MAKNVSCPHGTGKMVLTAATCADIAASMTLPQHFQDRARMDATASLAVRFWRTAKLHKSPVILYHAESLSLLHMSLQMRLYMKHEFLLRPIIEASPANSVGHASLKCILDAVLRRITSNVTESTVEVLAFDCRAMLQPPGCNHAMFRHICGCAFGVCLCCVTLLPGFAQVYQEDTPQLGVPGQDLERHCCKPRCETSAFAAHGGNHD